MSNTHKRILSAIALIILVLFTVYLGPSFSLGLILILGAMINDEIFCNFFKKNRFSIEYLCSQLILILPYIYLNYLSNDLYYNYVLIDLGLALNMILLYYLFFVDMESKVVTHFSRKYPWIAGLYILLPLISMTIIFHYSKWKEFLALLLFVTYGMDTGAWFFGKKFGKRKLWPDVSPNKTVEGFVGGAFTSAILGGIFWFSLFSRLNVRLFVFFMFLGVMSQLGDLVESKFKRQFELKDSSSLIPGHGGVYDRVDSLFFLSPFYALAIWYFYLNS